MSDRGLRDDEPDFNAVLRVVTTDGYDVWGHPIRPGNSTPTEPNIKTQVDKAEAHHESAAEIIDRLFRQKVKLSSAGKRKRLTIFEAIVHQLLKQALVGDTKAYQALVLYSQFGAETQIEADCQPKIIVQSLRDGVLYRRVKEA